MQEVQQLVTGETRDVHVRSTENADKDLEVTKRVEEIFRQLTPQAENHVDRIPSSKKRRVEMGISFEWPGQDWARTKELGSYCGGFGGCAGGVVF